MEGDPMGVVLPDDALAAILHRLPPRSLAASRSVCKAWRAIIDGRRLLLPKLLPHSVRGIFLMYNDLDYPCFLSHPSMESDIFRKISFYRDPGSVRNYALILDHCNGLLLYKHRRGLSVANPAMQRQSHLPLPPARFVDLLECGHLVYDPAESAHYELLLVPDEPFKEWSASTLVLCVFSSRKMQWEERTFVREGEAISMPSNEACSPLWRSRSAYWPGVFFVQCTGGSTVMRISLSNDKYRVIKAPTDIGDSQYYDLLHVGRSKEGLCCASVLYPDWCKLRVWILDDSCDKTDWVLKHHIDFNCSISRVVNRCKENKGPWNLLDANNHEGHNNALVKSKVEWDSDIDDIVDNESEVQQGFEPPINVLGFHPYKDIIFLDVMDRAMAYHPNTYVGQDLGNIWPEDYCSSAACITSSFLYTPCLMAGFPEIELEDDVEG